MVSKRQLGFFVIIVGLVTVAGTVAVELTGSGAYAGFGPLQWVGLGAGLTVTVVGLLLIRLGDRPA
jgi:hypothetical protein